MRSPALAVIVVALVPAAAAAQVQVVRYGDDRLAGITEVDVLVSLTEDPAGRCPVERAGLEALAGAVLRQAGITATISRKASSWFYSVLIDVTTAAAGSSCASSLTTDLVAQVEGIPDANRGLPVGVWGSRLVGAMPLLHYTDLVTSTREEHDAVVRQAGQVRLVVVGEKLRAANP
jgi:hypothetical protein